MSRRCSVTAITGAKANTHVATTSAAIWMMSASPAPPIAATICAANTTATPITWSAKTTGNARSPRTAPQRVALPLSIVSIASPTSSENHSACTAAVPNTNRSP